MQSWPRSSSGILETSEDSLRRLRGQHLSNNKVKSAKTTVPNLRKTTWRQHPVLWRMPPLVICYACRSRVLKAFQGSAVFVQNGTISNPKLRQSPLNVHFATNWHWAVFFLEAVHTFPCSCQVWFSVCVRSKVSEDSSRQWRVLPSWKPVTALTLT